VAAAAGELGAALTALGVPGVVMAKATESTGVESAEVDTERISVDDTLEGLVTFGTTTVMVSPARTSALTRYTPTLGPGPLRWTAPVAVPDSVVASYTSAESVANVVPVGAVRVTVPAALANPPAALTLKVVDQVTPVAPAADVDSDTVGWLTPDAPATEEGSETVRAATDRAARTIAPRRAPPLDR